MTLSIHLVRHGHTRYTGQRDSVGRLDSTRVAGRTDVELSEDGEAAALELARTLDPRSIHAFYSSTLIRAVQTATLLGAPQVIQDNRLCELDFGEWEGLEWQEVHERYPEQLASWSDDWVNVAPPGGESFIEIGRRGFHWLQEIRETEQQTDRQIVVTAHAGIIRAILCRALDLPLSLAMKFSIDYVHVTTLVCSSAKGHANIQCTRLNSTRF